MAVERVQTIAFSSILVDTIPPEFIRSEKEQPALTTCRGCIPQVPTIDFSDPDEGNLTRLIAEASSEWGMFQIVNHGIPSEVITNLKKAGKEFFELPQEEKELYAKPPDSKSIEGYGSKLQKEVEGKKAWVDHLFHNIWPPSAINYQYWPKNPPSYRFEIPSLFYLHYASSFLGIYLFFYTLLHPHLHVTCTSKAEHFVFFLLSFCWEGRDKERVRCFYFLFFPSKNHLISFGQYKRKA